MPYVYAKQNSRATALKFFRGPYGTILHLSYLKPIKYKDFIHFWHVCKLFGEGLSIFSP